MSPLGVIVIFVVFALVMAAAIGTPAHSLKNKFAKAGVLRGRTKADIIAAVGPPTTFSGAQEGKTVLQWIVTSSTGAYHVALLFDANDVCEGVTHEHDSTR